MRINKLFYLAVVPLFLFATNSAFAYIEKDTAVIRIMNKAAGKTKTVSVGVGKTVQYDNLTITAHNCKQSDPFDAENFYAFVEITKDGNGKIYSNWMNRNNPGDMPLQNADYDVWLVECK